jgi:hypothetical protein
MLAAQADRGPPRELKSVSRRNEAKEGVEKWEMGGMGITLLRNKDASSSPLPAYDLLMG